MGKVFVKGSGRQKSIQWVQGQNGERFAILNTEISKFVDE